MVRANKPPFCTKKTPLGGYIWGLFWYILGDFFGTKRGFFETKRGFFFV